MLVAGYAGGPADAPNRFRDLQEFDGVFPFVVVSAIIGQPVAGPVEKPLQAHVATGPDLWEVLPGRVCIDGFSAVDEEVLE